MLMRSFTKREKALLLVLVLIVLAGLYMLLVHTPVERSLTQLAEEKEDAELLVQVAQVRAARYNQMKNELEEIFSQPKDQITVMPPYDNTKALMVELNHIFGELEYNLAFSDVVFQEGVAIRAVQFTFDAPSYEVARNIIDRLGHTGNRSLMNTLTIAPNESSASGPLYVNSDTRNLRRTGSVSPQEKAHILSGPQTVSGTITFYELAPETAAPAEETPVETPASTEG